MTETIDQELNTDDRPDVQFDLDTVEIELASSTDVSEFDLETLEEMGVLSVEYEERDGKHVATSVELDMDYLRLMATEFNTVERSMGRRFAPTRYRPDIRLRW